MSELLTTWQVQELLKVDRITIYRMLNDGRLRGIKIGNQWRFQTTEIQRLLGEEIEDEITSSKVPALVDFPVECVQKLQNIYAGILGIGSVAVNLQGAPLTEPTVANPFCELMLASESGLKACQASWSKMKAGTQGKLGFQVCHAGLYYLCSAISIDEKKVAHMISGQFYTSHAFHRNTPERLRQLSEKHGIDLKNLSEAEKSIPVLNKQQQAKVVEWTPKVAETIQSFICERVEIMDRLQRIAELSTITPALSK